MRFERTEDGEVGVRAGGESSCAWRMERVDGYWPVRDARPQPTPEHVFYRIFCGEEFVDARWVGPADLADGGAQDLLAEVLRRIPVPDAAVGAAPDGRGVTGIPSLFWVEGYGAPLQASESAFGMTVVVIATVVSVAWDFGDGTPAVQAGLGEAWPARSSVRHNYRDPGSYTVTARVVLQPTYAVDGVGGGPLESIEVETSRPYDVREVQAVRTR